VRVVVDDEETQAVEVDADHDARGLTGAPANAGTSG
jgi:hypothetical protein